MENLQPGWDQSEASLDCESKTGEFLLTWDNHRKNASEAFSSLRKDEFFCDVTLACQDQQFKAHKVVLAASSLFFEQVLQNHKHPNPLIYLKGVEVKHMEWLLDFMYCGVVSLQQVEVEDFLRAGEELSVKGLTVMVTPEFPAPPRKTFETSASPSMKINTSTSSPLKVKTPLVKEIKPHFDNCVQTIEDSPTQAKTKFAPGSPLVTKHSSLTITYYGQDTNENNSIEEKVVQVKNEQTAAMADEDLLQGVEKWEDLENYAFVINTNEQRAGHHILGCSICGKVVEEKWNGRKRAMDRMMSHIEDKHFRQAFNHPCAVCEETFHSMAMLQNHMRKNHTVSEITISEMLS